jgi:chemotaxis signal transduction protein
MQVLLVKIADNRYCIDINSVEEIINRKNTVKMEKHDNLNEGIFNYRDKVIHLYNLRKILGYKGFEEETLEFIKQIKASLISWVNELEDSLFNKTPFVKSFNSNECILGKWINKTIACLKCNNKGFVNLIQENLVHSHNNLHERGEFILQLEDEKEKRILFEKEIKVYLKECLEALEILENDINKLVHAFERIIIYKDSSQDKIVGLTVDDVERMILIKEDSIKDTSSKLDDNNLINSKKIFIAKNSEIIPILSLNIDNFLSNDNKGK